MLEIDFGSAMEDVDLMLARLADPSPLLEVIGQTEVAFVRARITSLKEDPAGGQWAPWSPWRAAERAAKGNASQGLLWDSGALLNSITAQVDGPVLQVGSTAGDYAKYLQEGWTSLAGNDAPARPFLGWDADALAFYETLTVTYLQLPA
jgi:phage gpG-like protein